MSKLSAGLICSILLLVSGCGPVQSTVLQGEHLVAYSRVFNEDRPEDVEVIHSFLVTYTPRIGVVTTADYEIELIVSEQWIHVKNRKLHLRKVEDPNSSIYKHVSARKENRANDWYAPRDISNYELYYLYLTSIPYVHMLVDKEPVGDDRYRVFISKH